jgi:signal transduction histidine kinase
MRAMARVLLHESDPALRARLQAALTDEGHEVSSAEAGGPNAELVVLGPSAPRELALALEAAGAPLITTALDEIDQVGTRVRRLLRERAVQAAADPRAFLAQHLGRLSAELRNAARAMARVAEARPLGEPFVAWPGDTGAATPGPADVGAALDEAVAMARDAVVLRAELVERRAPMPPVLASGRQLSRVFFSLLTNAVEATPEGRPAAHRIEVRSSTDAAGWAVVEVADTGSGIAPTVLPRIFEPGYTTKGAHGIGLGLAVCHNTITALGGRLSVESELGRGSTFQVALPPAKGAAADG